MSYNSISQYVAIRCFDNVDNALPHCLGADQCAGWQLTGDTFSFLNAFIATLHRFLFSHLCSLYIICIEQEIYASLTASGVHYGIHYNPQ